MMDKKSPASLPEDIGVHYEIRVKGQLEEHWSDWLGGLEISHDENGNSLLTGVIPDQAALHGILNQIRDLGLTLISISQHVEDAERKDKADETNK